MPTSATSPRGGRSRRIRSAESRWQLKIFSQKPAGKSGSYLGGGLRQNSGGYLVRDDLPLLTTAAPTVVARQPASTSRLEHGRQAS